MAVCIYIHQHPTYCLARSPYIGALLFCCSALLPTCFITNLLYYQFCFIALLLYYSLASLLTPYIFVSLGISIIVVLIYAGVVHVVGAIEWCMCSEVSQVCWSMLIGLMNNACNCKCQISFSVIHVVTSIVHIIHWGYIFIHFSKACITLHIFAYWWLASWSLVSGM